MPNGLSEKKTWLLFIFVSLWSPLIHLIRWALTPDGYTYFFFFNQDSADWHYILKSADNHFLSIHDVEKDVPIWFRPDAHAILFFPFILLGKLFSLPSFILLISIDILGNFFCAFATYFFFQTFFSDSQKSLLAFLLVYFSSGIIGLIMLFRWASLGDFVHALLGWVGENHSLGYDLMEGNMVHWTTIIFRPYYIIPRGFGLLSVALLYKAYHHTPSKKYLILSSLFLFFAALIHPQSGLIFGTMAFILLITQLVRKEKTLLARLTPFFWTISGLFLAALFWKGMQRIPDVDEAVKEYLKRIYNADPVPLFFAVSTLLIPVSLIVFFQNREKIFFLLLALLTLNYSIAVSEWFIRDESISLRIILLMIFLIGIFSILFWKRVYLIERLKLAEPKIYFGLCAFVILLIAVSPHHDAVKILRKDAELFGAFSSIARSFFETLSLIYAAHFRLGITISLAGLLTALIWTLSSQARKTVLVSVFSVSAISILIYLYLLIFGKNGYLHNEEREAMLFLKSLDGKAVLCSPNTSEYLIQIAQKRTLLGGVAGVLNLEQRSTDIQTCYQTSDAQTMHDILKKYRIDYVYFGPKEKQFSSPTTSFSEFPVIFKNKSVMIFQVPSAVVECY